MKTTIKTTEDALRISDMGIKYFMAAIPGLKLRDDDPTKCISIKSPFNFDDKRSFSIYLYKRWMYKDHTDGDSGDVFKYIARTNHLNLKKDFPDILKIIEESVTKRDIELPTVAVQSNASFQYTSDYWREVLLKKHFTDCGCNISNTQFSIKAIEQAKFEDVGGNSFEIQSDLEKHNDVYFEIIDEATGVSLIYNPYREEEHYFHKSGCIPVTYLFGWRESLLYRNFHCPEVATNLLVTNSVENVMFLHSLGFPAVCLNESQKYNNDYLLKVVLPQCENVRIFFDSSPKLKLAAKKLSKAIGASIIEFSGYMQEGIDEDIRWHENHDKNRVYNISLYHQLDDEHIGEYLSNYIILNEIQ